MAEKDVIDVEKFGSYGVSVHGKSMRNTGERRFALRMKDGTSVTITQAGNTSGWQEAHYHNFTRELYVVSKGWIGYAILNPTGSCTLRRYDEGKSFMSEPKVAHTIFVPADAVFHTVKLVLDGYEFPDYYPQPELDALVRNLGED